MRRSQRYITSLFMAVLYLLITGMPLAPLAMHSKRVAHAVTGECSGDCGICGCAPERSAARACCCWQKKLASEKVAARPGEKSCCKKQPASRIVAAAPRDKADCSHDDHDDHEAAQATADNGTSDDEKSVTSISSCPCGSGKHLFHWGADTIQHLPSIYSGGIPRLQNHDHASLPPDRLTSHLGEPPDPPPKLSQVA